MGPIERQPAELAAADTACALIVVAGRIKASSSNPTMVVDRAQIAPGRPIDRRFEGMGVRYMCV